MIGGSARPFLPALSALLLGGCNIPHHDVAMSGNADGVIISYVGDVAETLPIAREHCARYERLPVLRQTKDENAVYVCVQANPPPSAGS
jgi:hypothetical protein